MSSVKELKFLGVDIEFPFEPYSIQKCMMSQIISRLTNKEHGLIESPTGTGKTLVLLCATLAWQRKSKLEKAPFVSVRKKKRIAEERMEGLKKKPCSCDPELKKSDCPACLALKAEEKFAEIVIEDEAEGENIIHSTLRGKIPRIYYGTRTHKQITQVVRELNKTPYKQNLRMCILSSRERTCINEDVKDLASRNDKCQELIKNKGSGKSMRSSGGDTCPYYADTNNMTALYEAINSVHDTEAWDIEDAAKFGRENKACPYFGIRSLQAEADITFCPYNYLIDPTIRQALDINLKDAIVIFDEAHNIEDICRDSASFVIDTQQIDDLIETINIATQHYIQGSPISDAYQFFKSKFLNLYLYLKKCELQDNLEYDKRDYLKRKIMNIVEMSKELQKIGLGPECLQQVKENLKILRGDTEDSDSNESSKKSSGSEEQPGFNSLQLHYITQLSIVLNFMYGSESKYFNDYRTVITQHLIRDKNDSSRNNWNKKQGTKSIGHDFKAIAITNGDGSAIETTENMYSWKLSLLCMNPGVSFERVHNQAWSVFVASGTLSPIDSLKTELGCYFSGTFQGTHVISRQRVFGSIVSFAPDGTMLNGSYKDSLSLKFQDGVGNVVRDVCKTVPNGVLVFFPSYDRMENLYQRWVIIGVMKEITNRKTLYREQRNVSNDEFEERLRKYNKQAEKKKGAILFAVYRGKVSEGIDFADKAARAVITIGIPYPNVKEITIGLKKEYNDQARVSKPQLMAGGDWYASQAFRALNQALGRCIRHKDDWGAIIMIDSRLDNEHSQKNLSRWFREALCSTKDYSRFHDWLKEFVSMRNEEELDVIEVLM